MPEERTSGKPTTKRYSEEEKAQAVRLVRQLRRDLGTEHGTVQRVAEQLGYGVETMRRWVKRADIDEGLKAGTSSEDRARMKALEQEVKELRRTNEILRKASAYFGLNPGGARPPMKVIVGFVDENRDELGVEPTCRALQVAPSSYYAAKRREREPSARAVRDVVMAQVLMVLGRPSRVPREVG